MPPLGPPTCSLNGRKRAFQPSDGSCLCQTGFVFYNQLDFKSSSADSRLDCQPEVRGQTGPSAGSCSRSLTRFLSLSLSRFLSLYLSLAFSPLRTSFSLYHAISHSLFPSTETGSLSHSRFLSLYISLTLSLSRNLSLSLSLYIYIYTVYI